jgi:subtilisin-like proprotein convertase family protein
MTLLEMRARLITRLGFATGNQRSLQLVTDGMKLDPISPNMLQGRDSILLADCAGFGGQDELDIWAGFAARGMGYSARYNSTISVTEAFDTPNLNLGAVTISNDSCPPPDGFADPGETLTLTIPLSNPFCATPANEVSISVNGGAPVSYGDIPAGATVSQGVAFTVPSDAVCGSQAPVEVVITSSIGTVTRTFNLQIGRPVSTLTTNYSSGNIAVPIPDVSTVNIPINVADIGAVADVNVKVRLNHTFDGDLTLSLIGPDGTSVVLAGNRGGGGQNFGSGTNDCSGVPTVFDDSASIPIGAGAAPFAGSFRPESPLAAFNGKPLNGVWVLRVTDGGALDVGTVGCVQLEITRQQFACCGAPGTPEIQPAPPATLVSESCAPGNGAPDPGETVAVNFPLLNVGLANTTNLVATLLEGGGVLAPSGPQTYGVLVSGGPAVARPFTFTVAGVCGGDITATLALQDGATSLGTVTFTIRIGAFVVRAPRNYGSGNIAVPLDFLTTVEIPFNVNDEGMVGDVNVKVRLNYNNDSALEMTLIGPDGTSVALVRRGSAAGQNFGAGANDCSGVPTVFDDSATIAIGEGTAPFAGSFKPDSPLSAFNGRPRNGIWTLRLTGVVLAFNSGTLGCVQLEIASQQLACCGVPGTPEIQAAPPVTVVNESCAPGNGAPDQDETVTVNFPLVNVGDGDTTNLVATLLEGGGVLAPSGPQTYGVLVSDGPAVARPFTFTVAGVCGSDITATLALQDGATSLGTVTFTIKIGMTITTSSFSNTAPILIPATGLGATTGAPSNPYPSTINVSGVTGTVTKVTAQLFRFGHGWTSDVDVLLVGPGGQKLILMSDVGLTVELPPWISTGGGDLTFDDAAPPMPINTKVVSGTYKPTNSGTGDLFPSPAPPGPYPDPQQLSVFNGVNPNGTWRLFVVDDSPHSISDVERGSIFGGWRLNITTSDTVCPTPIVSTVSGQYSDVVMLKANVANVTCPGGSVQFNVNGSVVGSAPVTSGMATLPYKILLAQGSYPIVATYFTSAGAGRSGSGELTVTREDAIVTPAASNPAIVQVSSRRGASGPINFCAAITETNDESPGDIGLATPVTFTLTPTVPGATPITQTATVSGGGVGGTLTACAALNNVPVNVYDVGISVGGNNYTGSGRSALAVFDPSLGSFKGIGTVVHNGRNGTFMFNVKYRRNGTPQGGLLYAERRPTGFVVLLTSSVQSLSVVGNTGVIFGKASLNGVGNHTFRATVVDASKNGRGDRFGLQVISPSGAIVTDMTFDPINLRGGNIRR